MKNNISYLTDKALMEDLNKAVKNEKLCTMKVLLFLREVDRRVLYANYSCSSLFSFCLDVLKYTEAEASIRISALKLIKKVPAVAEKISNGELSLSQASELSRLINKQPPEDKTEEKIMAMVEKIEGKSLREGRKILQDHFTFQEDKKDDLVQLGISRELYDKLQKLKGLMGILSEEEILNKICDEKIIKIENANPRKERSSDLEGRYIPISLKKKIITRAKSQCEHICEETLKRCQGRNYLEFHHVIPLAVGGATDEANILLVCRACNVRASILFFGVEKARFGTS